VAARTEVAALLTKMEAVVQRWHAQHATGEREAFERMNVMRSLEFARERARKVADALDLPADAPVVAEARPRRRATPGPAVH
jgi:cyanate lyase